MTTGTPRTATRTLVLRLSGLFGILAACQIAHGQSITSGNSVFNLPASDTTGASIRTGVGNSGAAMTAGGDSSDQLFQQWWWYRVNGVNTREFALSNRTANVAAGNVLTLDFNEPEGFTARVVYTLTDGADAPAAANLAIDVTITNTSQSTLSIALFGYIDLDLEGSPGDGAALLEPGRIEVTDQSTQFRGQFLGVNSDAYEVVTFSALRTALADSDVDNLGNVGLPFAPADFTAAQQWNLTLPPQANQTIRAAVALNQTAAANVSCPTDYNGSGASTVQDVFDFLAAWFNNDPGTDYNGVGGVTVQDVFDYLTDWFIGC